MLTLVLFLLFVHNSAVPMILKPLKSLANNKKMIMNKSLVEELADADPAQVEELPDLIETMLQDAHTHSGLKTICEDGVSKLNADCNTNGYCPSWSKSGYCADYSFHFAYMKACCQRSCGLCKDIVAVTVGPETLITPGGRDGWTGFSMINTNAVVPAHGSNRAVRLVGWQWNGFDDSNTITLQIYRLITYGRSNYQLIGQFTYASQKGLNEMVLADGLAVESGDFVGWTFHGSAAVGFTGGSDSVLWGPNNVQFHTVGNIYTFPGRGGRNYPIKANFEIYA